MDVPTPVTRATKVVAIAILVTLMAVSPAIAASWHRLHVWTSHGSSLTATRKLPHGTFRLVYMAKNPATSMQVSLDCGASGSIRSYPVRPRPKRVTIKSSGCKLTASMVAATAGKTKFMRLELDQR